MPQFLLSPEDIQDKIFTLRGPEAFHVTRVLRVREGQAIELFDGHGGRYTGVIKAIKPDGTVEGEITGKVHCTSRMIPADLTLYLGLLKASHWEWALEKGTEIGVGAFVPILTPRTVVQLREMGKAKEERWGKIVTAAAKQCKRSDIPAIRQPVHFSDAVIEVCKSSLTLLAWEKHEGTSTYAALHDVLCKAKKGQKRLPVNLFIGPEGGFSDDEVELAECKGAAIFSLGPNILRAETAVVAACAVIFHELGSL